MPRPINEDTIAYDLLIYDITIPASSGNAARLAALSNIPTDVRNRVVSWEVRDNSAAFKVSKESDLSPFIEQAGGQGFAPPLGTRGLGLYVKASADASVTAKLVVYLLPPNETVDNQ